MDYLPQELIEYIWSYLLFEDILSHSITSKSYLSMLNIAYDRGKIEDIDMKKCDMCERKYMNGEKIRVKIYNGTNIEEACSERCAAQLKNNLPRCNWCLSPVYVQALIGKYYCSTDCHRNVMFKRPRYHTF